MASESLILPDLMCSEAGLHAGYLRELLPAGSDAASLARAGVDAVRLAGDPDYRVPLHQACRLLDDLLRRHDDPLLAIRQARALSLRAFPLLGMSVLASTTLADGLARLIELDPLIWDGVRLHLDHPAAGDGDCALVMTPLLPLPPAVIELALAGWVLLGPGLWQLPADACRLSLRHAARAPAADYVALFGCRIDFGAEAYALHFPAAWLGRRLALADAGSSAIILQEARRRLAQPLQLENRLRAACFRALPGPLPDAARLAERLGLGARQLRELMAQHNIRLRELQDAVRREAALHWAGTPGIDLSELALACGFSEQSAFQRAFRRWTGCTPGQWRLQQPAAGT